MVGATKRLPLYHRSTEMIVLGFLVIARCGAHASFPPSVWVFRIVNAESDRPPHLSRETAMHSEITRSSRLRCLHGQIVGLPMGHSSALPGPEAIPPFDSSLSRTVVKPLQG